MGKMASVGEHNWSVERETSSGAHWRYDFPIKRSTPPAEEKKLSSNQPRCSVRSTPIIGGPTGGETSKMKTKGKEKNQKIPLYECEMMNNFLFRLFPDLKISMKSFSEIQNFINWISKILLFFKKSELCEWLRFARASHVTTNLPKIFVKRNSKYLSIKTKLWQLIDIIRNK